MTAPLFWDVTQHTLLFTDVSVQPAGPILLNCLNPEDVTGCSATSVCNYQSRLRNIPEGRISQEVFPLSWQMCHTILYVDQENTTAVILHLPRTTDIFSGLPQCHRYSCSRNSVLGYGRENRGTVVRSWQRYEIFIFLFSRTFRSALGPSGLLIQQEGDLFGDKAAEASS